jgi:hypothetical protein
VTDSPEYDYDYDAVARELDIGPDSSTAERTIDITTLGARTGAPRRSRSSLFWPRIRR